MSGDSALLPAMTAPAALIYMPASVKRKDHNYRPPESTLISQATTTSKIPAVGTDYIYGERAVTLEEAEQLAWNYWGTTGDGA